MGKELQASCRRQQRGEPVGFISVHLVPIREKGPANTTGLTKDSPGDLQHHSGSVIGQVVVAWLKINI